MPTATGSATCPASPRGCRTSRPSAWTRCGSHPFYVSPQADAGYDVADYRDVDPVFGRLDARRRDAAHGNDLGLRVIVDLVPNHTSDEHAWFRGALLPPARAARSGRATCSATARAPTARSRRTTGSRSSVAAPGPASPSPTARPASGTCTCSTASSPTSTGTTLRWAPSSTTCCASGSTEASTASGSTSRTASSRPPGLPDWERAAEILDGEPGPGAPVPPMWDQEGVHDVYRDWRRVLAEYDGDRILVAEAWVEPAGAAGRATCGPTRCTRPSTSTSSRLRGRPQTCAR